MPPNETQGDAVRRVAETWMTRRADYASRFTQADLTRFVESSDAMARLLIRELDTSNPDVYEALAEIATIAAAVVTQRKVFVNGQDATPPR